MPSNVQIDISVDDERWNEGTDLPTITQRAVEGILSKHDIQDGAELSVVYTNDVHVQVLNSHYRGKDKPTNVLSFPQDLPMLGDIVLAYETIEREASEQDKDFDAHLTHLLVHGILHLLGFDHEEDDQAEKMEALEIAILQEMGINNPYEKNEYSDA